ncbi:MAG: sulfite exporter TauE/SafE family protein [Acidobacteria bacterium]|nr:sulfite exporter TauE/SafE family protein [Acidobacteriota bacterium]
MTLGQALLLSAASVGAGVVNALAGGGTLLTFPALLGIGVSPVAANATNTLALWPGQLSGAIAYRRHLGEERRTAKAMILPSILGGIGGTFLVLFLPEKSFALAVPWLILFACLLLAFQDLVKKALGRVPGSDHPAALWLAQAAISVYGGYFGAGMGILMLASMGILHRCSTQHANALKVLLSFLVNGISALCFLAFGAARVPIALLMALGATLGGWLGARLAQRLPPLGMRAVAIAVGVYAAGKMLLG